MTIFSECVLLLLIGHWQDGLFFNHPSKEHHAPDTILSGERWWSLVTIKASTKQPNSIKRLRARWKIKFFQIFICHQPLKVLNRGKRTADWCKYSLVVHDTQILAAYRDLSPECPSPPECLCPTGWCPRAGSSHSTTCCRPTLSTAWKRPPDWPRALAPHGRLRNTNNRSGFVCTCVRHDQITRSAARASALLWSLQQNDCVWRVSGTSVGTHWSWLSPRPGRLGCPGRNHLQTPCLGQASGIGCARQYPRESPFSHEPRWSSPPRERWGCLRFAWRRRQGK